MPQFTVKLLRAGAVQTLRVQAVDAAGVAAAAGAAPEFILSADETAPTTPRYPGELGRGRVGPFPLRLFSQDLAMLLDAGIPLLEALHALREKEKHVGVAHALDTLIARVTDGHALSAAFAAEPAAFGGLLPAVAAASERAGQLPATLREHADYLAWTDALRSRILAAATYPALLLAVGGAVVVFLLVYVMPRFAGLLDGMEAQIPWGSRWLLAAGRLAGEHPWLLLTALALLAVGATAAVSSARLQGYLLAACWRLPWLGQRLQTVGLARLYRTLGMLGSAGVPVYQALAVAAPTAAPPLQAALAGVSAQVAQGRRLSEALASAGMAGAVSRRMVEVGERSGTLPSMLTRAAAYHDEEVVRLADFIARVVNPVLMLVMGVVIGGLVVLMYLPIFQLVEQVQ